MKKILNNEIVKYIIFGVLTTAVYAVVRIGLYPIFHHATLVTAIANIVAVLFAFFTNDTFVFNQERNNWVTRLIKFAGARAATFVLDLVLAELFVERFPHIIGYFVNQDPNLINTVETLISQVLIIAINYLISKLFVFKNNKTAE